MILYFNFITLRVRKLHRSCHVVLNCVQIHYVTLVISYVASQGRTCKKVIVVEYMEFKDRKLVEQLQQLDCAQLVKVLHVNPFGPVKLEMVRQWNFMAYYSF